MATPTVSCICPTYRRPRFVELTVKLFLAQVWQKSELIIIDDSPAGERARISDHARIRVVRIGDKLSMGEKHDLGNALAQGDVLAYWDDDDFWGPRRLVRQLEPIVLGEAEITGIPRELVARVPSASFHRFTKDWFKNPGVRGNTVGNWSLPWHDGTTMYSRRALSFGVKHPPVNINQKVQFINALVAKGMKWKAITNDGAFVYVRHDAKSAAAPNSWQFGERRVLEAVPVPMWFPAPVLEYWRGLT